MERPPEERARFAAEACGGDATMLAAVTRLLQAAERSAGFLEQPVVRALSEPPPGPPSVPAGPIPGRLGRYTLVRLLAEGGMGVVYLGEDPDGQGDGRVAIKVIRQGMDSPTAVGQFQHEREILSTLTHPNIARLLDGGADEAGRPFLVMEYIDGEPITEYCRRHELTVAQRLALFCQVCDAVSHAHQHLVVHRDIKPGNILVTADGTPKLLDFGLAKLVDLLPGDEATRTATLTRMLTPEYASPEQLRGERISTASDVYSLGVVLYELLNDQRPYRLEWLASSGAALMMLGAPPERIGFRVRLPSDLCNVILMAIRPEAHRRYQSVEAFAEDVRRFLAGLPVKARPETFWYRAGKFYRRHQAAVVATVAVGLALVGGIVATTWQARRAEEARARADRRYQDLRSLANALLVEFEGPISALAGSTEVREALVLRALEYLRALELDSEGDPSLQRELAMAFTRVGEVQLRGFGLESGDTEGALGSYLRALAIREQVAAADGGRLNDLDAVADSLWHVAQVLGQMGRHREYLGYAQRAVAVRERLVAQEPERPGLRSRLGQTYQTLGTALLRDDRCAEALTVFQQQLTLRLALVAERPEDPAHRSYLGSTFRSMGLAQAQCGDEEGAVATWLRAVPIDEELDREQPHTERHRNNLARTCSHLGRVLCRLGKTQEGLGYLYRAEALGEDLRQLDPKNALVRERLAATYRDLGAALVGLGQRRSGIEHLLKAEALLADWAQASPTNVVVRFMLAEVFDGLGDAHQPLPESDRETSLREWRQAREYYRRSLAVWESLRAEERLMPVHRHRPGDAAAAVDLSERMVAELRRPPAP